MYCVCMFVVDVFVCVCVPERESVCVFVRESVSVCVLERERNGVCSTPP